jgi:hypothetical protein
MLNYSIDILRTIMTVDFPGALKNAGDDFWFYRICNSSETKGFFYWREGVTASMKIHRTHSTIGLKNSTKAMLDRSRAPGQCYDGFLCQLMDIWKESHSKSKLNHGNIKFNTLEGR